MSMVDAPAFDHQQEAGVATPKDLDRPLGHFVQGWLPRDILVAIDLIVHVARFEEAEQAIRLLGVDVVKLVLVPDVTGPGPILHPFGRQIPPVLSGSGFRRIFRVRLVGRHEVASSATQDHVDSVALGELDQLPRDVRKADGACTPRLARVVLPSAFGGMGVAGRRGRVRHRRRGDDAGGESALFRTLEQGLQLVSLHARGVASGHGLVDAQDAGTGLDPRHHRGHGPGGIRCLLVGVVGLDQGDVRKFFEGQYVLFAGLAPLLPFEDPGGRHRRDPHAVADEQDDVLRVGRVRPQSHRLGDCFSPRLVPDVAGRVGTCYAGREQSRRKPYPRTSSSPHSLHTPCPRSSRRTVPDQSR